MFAKKLSLRIFLLLIFSDLLETCTHFCFKKSVLALNTSGITALGGIMIFLKGAFLSYFLWLGLLSVAITFIVWSTILSKIDLSVAVPLASFSYILIPLVSIVFLHEQVSLFRWCGITLILAGVIFVSLSSKERALR